MLPKIPLHTRNEWVLGKPRWKWVVHAAKALVGTTDGHLRWVLVRGGFDEFRRVSRPLFQRAEPGITYTDDELRWMFQVLDASLPPRFREAQMAKEIERFQRKELSEKMLKGDTLDGDGSVQNHDGPTTHDGGITIETLRDSEKAPLVH